MIRRFLRDRRGNVLPMFAIGIIPIIGFVGVSVDYSRLLATRTAMQAALDATALLMSKEASTLTPEQVTAKGQTYFAQQFNRPEAKNVNVTATVTPGAGLYTIKMNVTADVDTTVVRVLGHDQATIATSAEVVWGMKRLELALALDNTGSMASSSKMTELRKATRSLLNTLHKAAKKAGDVKVAIVPFATDVNVGKSNQDASWLDWSGWSENNGVCRRKSDNDRTSHDTQSDCISSSTRYWTPVTQSDWNGCLWDRDQSYDTNDTAPSGVATAFQPHQASNCPAQMLGLTDIFTDNAWVESDLTASTPTSVLGKKVKEMSPTGATNVTIGMAWGWHAVTKGEPLTAAADPKADLDKVVILLTDGDNTRNRWDGNGSDSCSQCDARTRLVCTNAKAAGVKIYSVRVINGNADLLKECASNPGMYFDVQEASQLNAVFSTIAQNLASLRIAK